MQNPNMDKVFTEYPFVDVLIYYVKELGMKCIVKSETEAVKNETTRTEFMGDLYTQSVEGTADWRLYDYTVDILARAGVPSNYFQKAVQDPAYIPEEYRDKARDEAAKVFIANYVEENNYYRKITGLPNLGHEGLVVPEDLRIENIGIDYRIPLHEMDDATISELEERGIWDNVLARYTEDEYDYLKYIKSNIDIYKARKATEFQLLWLPSIDNSVVKEKFERRFNVNRAFAINTIYSEAHRFDSKYYDAWLTIFIIIQTMIDLISEVQEHIINLDVFDERCVRYIFMSHGVPYYDEIPLIYQVRMMRRLHELLKYKSTAKCMVDICSIFGFDDLRIFKYYLLRDRKVDEDTGEYIFNYKVKQVLDTDQKVDVANETLTNFASNGIKIPFPHENFLDKGGAVFVNVDGKRVLEDKYTITKDGKLNFKDANFLRGKSKLEFIFFSNNEFNDDISNLDGYKIITSVRQYPITDNKQKNFTIEYPIADFTDMGGLMYLSTGGTFIDPKRYTVNGNNITFNEDTDWAKITTERLMSVVFIYSPMYPIKSKITEYNFKTVTDTAISSFDVPEPYYNYLQYGGEFFALYGSVLLPSDRYMLNGKNFSFVYPQDKVTRNRSIVFNNIYTEGFDVELEEKFFTTTVQIPGMQDYEIEVPFKGYQESEYPIEVFLDGKPIYSSEYTFLKNKIKILDQTKVLRTGVEIKIHFIYPKNRDRIKLSSAQVEINRMMSSFKINFPYEGYDSKRNKWLITINGEILDRSNFIMNGNILSFRNSKDYVDSKDIVKVYFFQDPRNNYTVHITEDSLKARVPNQKVFTINYPFYNYEKSGNGMIVTVGGTIIDKSRYTVSGTMLTLDDSINLEKGREVRCIFIYNSIYDNFNNYIRTEYNIYDFRNGKRVVDIPYPYDNFLESDNNNQMQILCEDGTILEENVDYEIVDDQALFSNVDKILEHGDTILFTFSYVNAKRKNIFIEDPTKDYDLKFVKIPLNESADNYIRDESKYIDYDLFTEDDWLWTNEFDPLDIKNQILEKEFNYARTKYISIDTVMSMSDLSFKIPYFFNTFFDDTRFEDRIRLSVPNIRPDKTFKLSSILCYLFSLSYLYYNKKDTIQTETVPIMYIQGFNFDADLDLLRRDIERKYGYTLEDLKVADFKKYKPGISMKGLMNILEENTKIYDVVVKGMYYADNKRIYDAYKAVYDALLIKKFSNKFFRVNGDQVAKTYTEYLRYQDIDLYNSILRMKSIGEDLQRKKAITNAIMDTVKYIEVFMGSEDYKQLFNYLPGIGIDYLKMYVSKVIDFFKSYKIELAGLTTVYNFDRRYNQYIKPIDAIKYLSKLRNEDFELFYDGFSSYLTKKYEIDNITQKELVYILRYYFKKYGIKDHGISTLDPTTDVHDKIHIYAVLKRTDDLRKLIKKELIIYTNSLRLHHYAMSESFDRIKPRVRGKRIDNFELTDHVYVSQYDSNG